MVGVSLLDLQVTLLAGFITAAVGVLLYRRIRMSFWGFLGGIAADWPKYFLGLLGATNIHNVLLFTHTAGIFLFPVILVILDILFLEIAMIKYLRPFYILLPNGLRSAIKFEEIINRLQHYSTLPRPIRIGRAYLIGVIGGVINLVISFALGVI